MSLIKQYYSQHLQLFIFSLSNTSKPSLRKRFKESKCIRRKPQRDSERKSKRNDITEGNISSDSPPVNVDSTLTEPSCSTINVEIPCETEDGTGFNSEDEYTSSLKSFKDQNLTEEEWIAVSILKRVINKLLLGINM